MSISQSHRSTAMTMKLLLTLFVLFISYAFAEEYSGHSCSLDGDSANVRDPALKEMTFDIGDGPQTFLAYVEPDVTSFYKDIEPPGSKKVIPKHKGLAGLFINMSNKPVKLYWEPFIGGAKSIIDVLSPFSGGGTATFPTHSFVITSEDKTDTILQRFKVGKYPNNVYVFDPYLVEGDAKQTEDNLKVLDKKDRASYEEMRKTVLFGEEYKKFTGRSYLVNYPRPRPGHHIWRADHFNQTHWVTTRETHFVKMPSPEEVPKIMEHGAKRVLDDNAPRMLSEYRTGEATMNLTIKAISCAPRVFEIQNFLSPVEVQHLLQVASGEELGLSSTGLGNKADSEDQEGTRVTRTSYNSWLERERSPIVDAIYRRASDVLRVDESLLRYRGNDEHPDLGTKNTIAESLQLVHYDPDQEYTAHHDFGYSDLDEPFQAQRFATILLYLNEGMEGGATTFPRWSNAETFEELKVIPEVGKAVLFYSQLPDGNMDDLSQHEAKKVRNGEKWLVNLWVWSPVYSK